MAIKPEDIKEEHRKTLHLHGKDFENLESQPEPVDPKADEKMQQKFDGEHFYGSRPALGKMLKADKETRKFDNLTREDRINPKINHERLDDDVQ